MLTFKKKILSYVCGCGFYLCNEKALIRWMLRTGPVHLKPLVDTAAGEKTRREESVRQRGAREERCCPSHSATMRLIKLYTLPHLRLFSLVHVVQSILIKETWSS